MQLIGFGETRSIKSHCLSFVSSSNTHHPAHMVPSGSAPIWLERVACLLWRSKAGSELGLESNRAARYLEIPPGSQSDTISSPLVEWDWASQWCIDQLLRGCCLWLRSQPWLSDAFFPTPRNQRVDVVSSNPQQMETKMMLWLATFFGVGRNEGQHVLLLYGLQSR